MLFFITIFVSLTSALAFMPFKGRNCFMQLNRNDLAKKIAVGAFTTFSFGLLPYTINVDKLQVNQGPIHTSYAVADSTGKMSTKLTARKRYLPRIKEGVSKFKTLTMNPTKEGFDKFKTDDLPSFQRALGLYGASLRKGEVPDEISREADKLTDNFVEAVNKVRFDGDIKLQINAAQKALDNYIDFAKVEL